MIIDMQTLGDQKIPGPLKLTRRDTTKGNYKNRYWIGFQLKSRVCELRSQNNSQVDQS